MTTQELLSKLHLILGQCKSGPLYWVPQYSQTVSGPKTQFGGVPRVYRRGQSKLTNEQVPLLRILFGQCSTSELQSAFLDSVRKKASTANAAVVAHVLADLHRIEHFQAPLDVLAALWSGWKERLEHASEYFTEADLSSLAKAVSPAMSSFPTTQKNGRTLIDATDTVEHTRFYYSLLSIGPLISLIRYERLKAELTEQQNPEINTDRQALISRSMALGFPAELEHVLEEIDLTLSTASSPFDFKACIGHIRTVLEKVFEHSAALVSAKSGKPLSPNAQGGKFNETKGHLVSEGLLSEKEGNAVQALYSYISADGAHSFGSAPEQARIAKNNTIEWSLLVVGRIQQFVTLKA